MLDSEGQRRPVGAGLATRLYLREQCPEVTRRGYAVQWLRNLFSTSPLSSKHAASIVRNQSMKFITHKQMRLAMEHLAGLLKKDGASQTHTVQEWLDVAQPLPGQFASSLPALEILGLLGFGDELVQPETSG